MSFLQRFQQSADNVANEYAQRQGDIDAVNARGLAKFNETQNYNTQTQNASLSLPANFASLSTADKLKTLNDLGIRIG